MAAPHAYDEGLGSPADNLVEVPVYAGVVRSAADLLDLLGEFLASASTTVRTELGEFINGRQAGLGGPAVAAAVTVNELVESAELLHALAGRPGCGL